MLPSSESPQVLSSAPRSALSPADLRRRALIRLAEKIDPVRSRHKPLSLVRQEARRVLDQFLDTECPTLTRSDRDKLVEDILAEGLGYGLFEELFRDDLVKEFQILGPDVVMVRKNDAWQPAAVKFRDADQLRQVIVRYAEFGEGLAGGVNAVLPNGFRVVAVLPAEGMELPPIAWFVRGVPQPTAGSGVVSNPRSGARPMPKAEDAEYISMAPPTGSEVLATAMSGRHSPSASGRIPQPSTSGRIAAFPAAGAHSGRMPQPPSAEPAQDVFARDRQKITERMIGKLASAGIYDLAAVPLPELRRFVLLAVAEYSDAERLGFAAGLQERLALEILAAMHR